MKKRAYIQDKTKRDQMMIHGSNTAIACFTLAVLDATEQNQDEADRALDQVMEHATKRNEDETVKRYHSEAIEAKAETFYHCKPFKGNMPETPKVLKDRGGNAASRYILMAVEDLYPGELGENIIGLYAKYTDYNRKGLIDLKGTMEVVRNAYTGRLTT